MSNLGRMGEAYFKALCLADSSPCAAVINQSADDQHGWDFIVDIPPPPAPNAPQDLQRHLLQCFAQIKSTRSAKPRATLKLSNALKAAKSPNPYFLFLLQYVDGIAEPVIFGRHVGKDEVAQWLKRARETESSGRKDIHKQSVTVKFDKEHKLNVNPVDWILTTVDNNGGQNYAETKLNWEKSVGYSDSRLEGTLTIAPLETANDIVLHELGLIDDLPVEKFQLFDKRFGLRSVSPLYDLKNGKIRITPSGSYTNLQITSSDHRTFDIP